MAREQSYAQGVVFVALATLGWSLSGVFVRHLPDLSGWQINCWRGYWMGVALLVYLVAVYGDQTGARFRAIPLGAFVAVAAFFVLGSTLYVTSLTLASTANVSCLAASAPIFSALLSRIVTGESPSPATWVAALMALAGVAYLVQDGFEAGNFLGNLAALATALSFACQTVTLRRYRDVDLVPAMCVGGFAVFLVAGLVGNGFAVPAGDVLVLALMGPAQLALPIILFVRSARSVPAVAMSLIALLDVVLNPLWSWIGVGETPTFDDAIGGGVIVAAVILSIVYGRRAAQVARQARATSGAV